jgi:uncharacterized protein YbjT (DUF2867 family)
MILVTGATGTVGTHLVRELAGAGERPRALVRDLDRARERLGEWAEPVVGDLGAPDSLAPALAGVDRVFVLTATGPEQYEQERNIIEAARTAGVGRMVKLSVVGAAEDSPLHHGRWQHRANRLMVESGAEYTLLQMSFFMQTLFGMVNGGALFSAAGDGRIAMVDARDVAAVAAAALTTRQRETADRTLTLTGPEALSFDDTARILGESVGTPVRHVRVSRLDLANMISRFRPGEWYAEDIVAFNDLVASGKVEALTGHVRELTGAAPRSLAEFARDYKGAFSGPGPQSRPPGTQSQP